MPEPTPAPFPLPPRVLFLQRHGYEFLGTGAFIPYSFIFIFAPLYDHTALMEQFSIIVGILVLSYVIVMYLISPWKHRRVGSFKPQPPPIDLGDPEKKRWLIRKIVCAVVFTAASFAMSVGLAYLLHINPGNTLHWDAACGAHGWMERTVVVWIFMLGWRYISRLTDKTELPVRRVTAAIATLILGCAAGFTGATAHSYPAALVIYGLVMLVMELLDIWLLLHFAATPLQPEMEGHHA